MKIENQLSIFIFHFFLIKKISIQRSEKMNDPNILIRIEAAA